MGRFFLEHLLFDLMVQEFSDIAVDDFWGDRQRAFFDVYIYIYIYIRVIYLFAPSNIDNPLWPLLISPWASAVVGQVGHLPYQ